MKDELMNVKIKFTEQSARLAELKQEVSRLELKVRDWLCLVGGHDFFCNVEVVSLLKNACWAGLWRWSRIPAQAYFRLRPESSGFELFLRAADENKPSAMH